MQGIWARRDWPGTNLQVLELAGCLLAQGMHASAERWTRGRYAQGRQAPGCRTGPARRRGGAAGHREQQPLRQRPHRGEAGRQRHGLQLACGRIRGQRAGLQHDQRLALALEAAPGDLRAARPRSRQGSRACARPARGPPHGGRLAGGAAPERLLRPYQSIQRNPPSLPFPWQNTALLSPAAHTRPPGQHSPLRHGIYVSHPSGPSPRAIATVAAQAADLRCAGTASVPVRQACARPPGMSGPAAPASVPAPKTRGAAGVGKQSCPAVRAATGPGGFCPAVFGRKDGRCGQHLEDGRLGGEALADLPPSAPHHPAADQAALGLSTHRP
jgi:hypothetical protein